MDWYSRHMNRYLRHMDRHPETYEPVFEAYIMLCLLFRLREC